MTSILIGGVSFADDDAAARGLSVVDQAELRAFYVELAPVIKGMAAKRLNWPDWEDAVSETFEVIVEKWALLPADPVSRRAYVCATARNKIYECYTKRTRWKKLQDKLSLEWEWWVEADVGLDPVDIIAEAESVKTAFRALSTQDQEIINLTGVWKLTPEQAAAALGCSKSAVTTRSQRARERFASALQAQDSEPEKAENDERA